MLWQPLVTKLIETQAINLKDGYCCGDHKRTQQGVSAKLLPVVATTRWNGTHDMLTSAKLFNGLSSSGDYKRTRQGALTILSTIYIHGSWSMLQQYLSSP